MDVSDMFLEGDLGCLVLVGYRLSQMIGEPACDRLRMSGRHDGAATGACGGAWSYV
jgi:hypothetical protein